MEKIICIQILQTVTEAGGRWHRTIAGAGLQSTGQTAAVVSMVINQIGNGSAAVFFRQIKFSAGILFDMIMLHVGMWPACGMESHKLSGRGSRPQGARQFRAKARQKLVIVGIINLHFRVKRERVKPFRRGVTNDKTALLIFLLQQRLGALS